VSLPVNDEPPPDPPEDLAGAIDLYRHLVRHGPVDVDRLPGGAAAGAVGTLCALGLASSSGRRLVPVPPTAAVAQVLAARQRELAVRQEALRRAYRDLIRLHEVLSSRQAGDSTARQVLPAAEAAELADRLRRGARRELLDVWTTPAAFSDGLSGPPLEAGVSHRVIVDRSAAHTVPGEQLVAALRRHAEVRLATGVTACLRVADGEDVLVWPLRSGYDDGLDGVADGRGLGATYIRSPAVAAAARGLFELLWSGGSDALPSARPTELTAAQWRILRLMTTGTTDAALAAAAGATVKTVRSHITAILLVLGVSTRFAAGVEAARRGWL
jgi:DNA-binding CsgD family transcriptional regulator